jgi:hypothetical protein
MWLVFSVVDCGNALSLIKVSIPDPEGKPEAALAIPEGREQVPYFVLR